MYAIYLVVGAFAGVMAGLFGIGGGVVVIPALATMFMHHTEIPHMYIMQMAVGTSLATVVITGTSSMYAHHKHAAVIWPHVWKMLPGLMIGAVIGAAIAHFLPSNFLRIFFAVFLAITSVRMWIKQKTTDTKKPLPPSAVWLGSIVIGMLSSILGVGGGTLLVPFLMRSNLDMHKATGTSVACGIGVSLIATICFMITGLLAGIHLPYSTGYIYWPAFLGIAVASVLFAPFGANLAHKLPKEILKRIFAVFLLIMAVDMGFFSK
jgi:uncharacterized membrane protein YfcA